MEAAANENKAGASAKAAASVKAENLPVPKYFRGKRKIPLPCPRKMRPRVPCGAS